MYVFPHMSNLLLPVVAVVRLKPKYLLSFNANTHRSTAGSHTSLIIYFLLKKKKASAVW